jgi:enediyne biosynthesis protein E4
MAALAVGVWLAKAADPPKAVPGECGLRFDKPVDLGFVLRNSVTPERHQIETMVGGVAAFDFDNDGLVDIFFVNGAEQPSLRKTSDAYWNRLYRSKGNFEFEDVTEKAGLAGKGYDIAVATADYDNDGYVDIFVAGVTANTLYRNRGDGTFEDVTEKVGLASPGKHKWAVSAAWLDFDNDGHLDLLVVNYVIWDPATEPYCGDPHGRYRTYCHPKYYTGLANALFRNKGDGTFEDVSQSSGIGAQVGKGMGASVADYNRDGWMDIFVANDTTPNFLFRNEGKGKFSEVGLRAGVAFNDDGRALSSMGSDFRDVDNDGLPDVFVSALANETFPLFRNLGKEMFADVTYPKRIGVITLPLSGWSNGIADFDNDGWKDLFAACGDVQDNTELFSNRKSKLPNLVMLNQQQQGFTACLIGEPAQHRGSAIADFDNDGRLDLVWSRIGEKAQVLRNVTPSAGNWIGFRLTGTSSNRDALGTELRVVTASGTQLNHATTAVGYASASDKRVHFGLGTAEEVIRVEIRWPGGMSQTLEKPAIGRYHDISQPGGQ